MNDVNKKSVVWGTIAFLLASVLFTIAFYRYAVGIGGVVSSRDFTVPKESPAAAKEVVYISVISRYPPNIIYRGYQPLMDYLTMRTPYRFELKLCDDYNEAVRLLITKQATAAFLGSYVYIKAHREHGVIPILKPLNSNLEPFSRSVLFTTGAKPIYNVNDLRAHRLALPSEQSFSSNWMLHSVLPNNGLRPSDLDTIAAFPHHQSVIDQVLRGNYDAGVTREYLVRKLENRNVRILMYSDPFPSSPIVVARDHSRPVVEAMTEALLAVNRNSPSWSDVTQGWDSEFIHGFVRATDEDYQSVREIAR